MDNERGIYNKYYVVHEGASEATPLTDVFVLRPEIDEVALLALKAYADGTQNDKLSRDLWRWIAKIERTK